MTHGVIWLRLECDAADVTLFIAPDREGNAQAFARGGGRRLVLLTRAIPKQLELSVTALAGALGKTPVDEPDQTLVLRLTSTRASTDARAKLLRILSLGQAMPRWPADLRGRNLRTHRGHFWPAQAEEVGLELGLRDLIKREGLSAASAVEARAPFETAGFVTAVVDDVLFAARDQQILQGAVEAERCLRGHGIRAVEAAEFLGVSLGYPKCCVKAFARLSATDDLSLAAALLPAVRHAPSSVLTQWLLAPLALVSHAPCSSTCPSTMNLARQILAGIEARDSGFTVRWLGVARGLHVVDEVGRCFVLRIEGHLDGAGPVVVQDALELLWHPEGGGVGARPATELTGQLLVREEGRLVAPGFSAALVADHSGQPDHGHQ